MTTTKPKPSRLEIAAMLFVAEYSTQGILVVDDFTIAIERAQALIDADEAFEKEREEREEEDLNF